MEKTNYIRTLVNEIHERLHILNDCFAQYGDPLSASSLGTKEESTQAMIRSCIGQLMEVNIRDSRGRMRPLFNKASHWQAIYRILVDFGLGAVDGDYLGFATYAATKSYVLSYSRALNSELKSRGIHVLAVCPNPMETDFFRDSTGAGVQGIKRLAIEKPEQVARKALAKAQKNKDVSLTNFSAYFLLILSRILPHRLVLWFERKFS